MRPASNTTENRSVLATLRALVPNRTLTFNETLRITELQANRLLELHGIDDGPIPDHLVANLPRIEVRYRRRLPISGASLWDAARRTWVISLNADEPHVRQRFTLMHEYAHVISHGFADRLFTGTDRATPTEQAERAADYFAGCLLLPKRLLKRAFGASSQRPADLAAIFDVSERAITVRLAQLGLNDPVPRCATTASDHISSSRRGTYHRRLPASRPAMQLHPEVVA